MRPLMFLAILLLLAAAGCGGNSVTGPIGGNASFTAKINGVNWTASSAISGATGVTGVPGGIGIIGSQLTGGVAYSININLFNIKGPGFYALGVSPFMYGGTADVVHSDSGWATDVSGLSGTITITTLTSTRIVGTFQFTGTAIGGTPATGMRTVTEGQFDLPLVKPVEAVANSKGNSASAHINGAPYVAWIAQATMKGAGGFSFTSSNTEHELSLFLEGVTTTGRYPLVAGVDARAIIISDISSTFPVPSWGATAADTGSITVTILNANRVKGTFNVLLKPDADGGGASGDRVVTGAFDIGTP